MQGCGPWPVERLHWAPLTRYGASESWQRLLHLQAPPHLKEAPLNCSRSGEIEALARAWHGRNAHTSCSEPTGYLDFALALRPKESPDGSVLWLVFPWAHPRPQQILIEQLLSLQDTPALANPSLQHLTSLGIVRGPTTPALAWEHAALRSLPEEQRARCHQRTCTGTRLCKCASPAHPTQQR